MTTENLAGTELTGQAQDMWEIVAPALQDSDSEPDLPARAYQALQTWPAHNLPHDLWQEILALLPLEDQTRLAHTSHPMREIVEQMAPQALDPTAHTTPDFIRTIYTQTELDHSLSPGQGVAFIPGTDSDLTIGHGTAEVHGPGTLTAVDGGNVNALGDIHITTVTDGTVRAWDQASIEEVTGGYVEAGDQTTITTVTDGIAYAFEQATIEEVTGGYVTAHQQATITTVTDGNVTARHEATITTLTGGYVIAREQATITTVTGGYVTADDQATITTVTGGTITAAGNATVTATGGDAHIVARGNAQVIIQAGADRVRVDAYDAADITAHNGTITLHSPDVTVTNNGDAVINSPSRSGDCAIL
ncbi:F-box protein [Streptomyces sp. NPDC057910]|uniref:F-box protein n=1 Tax=Streptomyces sp. NPDC057910 TaxID=3346278 RepID=UPI0036E078B8